MADLNKRPEKSVLMALHAVIHTEGLGKVYDVQGTEKRWAVRDLSLEIPEGRIFGLLGPNGAGKTTTIKMLATLIKPTVGQATIDGCDIITERQKVRKKIGIVMGADMIYRRLTGRDNLRFYGTLYRVKHLEQRIDELAHFFGLDDRIDSVVETYSTGMRSMLALARGIIHDPPILLLDEPTVGLDPDISSRVRDLILYLKSQGKTVLLCTHYMREAEYLCDQVAILRRGTVVAIGSPERLRRSINKSRFVTMTVNVEHEDLVERLLGERPNDGKIKIPFRSPGKLRDILDALASSGVEVIDVDVEKPSLEDVFLRFAKD